MVSFPVLVIHEHRIKPACFPPLRASNKMTRRFGVAAFMRQIDLEPEIARAARDWSDKIADANLKRRRFAKDKNEN